MNKFVISILTAVVVSGCSEKVELNSDFCRRMVDWTQAEIERHIADPKRTKLDAIDDFGPDQNAWKNYSLAIVENTYSWHDTGDEKERALKIANMRDATQDVCIKDVLGEK